MIIRMTVNDNDFTDVIERFAKPMFSDLFFGDDEEFRVVKDSKDSEKMIQYMDHVHDIQKLLNPNRDVMLDKDQRNIICNEVKKHWKKFIQNSAYIEDHEEENNVKEYLLKNFKVDIWYRFIDKFENGEVVYFFTTNSKFITQ